MAPSAPAKKKGAFDPKKFLPTIGEGRKVVVFPKNKPSSRDAADAVFSRKATLRDHLEDESRIS
jgi:hypothetical protein